MPAKHILRLQAEWRLQILALIVRDLENKKIFYATFNGECDVCNKPLKIGDGFYFLGQKERTCVKCIENIKSILNGAIDSLNTAIEGYKK